MTDLLEENERLYKANIQLRADKKALRDALKSFEKGYGCFCGCPHSRVAVEHSESCKKAVNTLEKTK